MKTKLKIELEVNKKIDGKNIGFINLLDCLLYYDVNGEGREIKIKKCKITMN